MPAQLKHAWLDLITAAIVGITYTALLPFVGPERATVAIALMSIGALAPLFYRKRPGGPAVVSDERDRMIQLRALGVSWATIWLFLVGFCMCVWQFHHGQTVRADLFPLMLTIGWVVVTLSRAVTTVTLYHRQG